MRARRRLRALVGTLTLAAILAALTVATALTAALPAAAADLDVQDVGADVTVAYGRGQSQAVWLPVEVVLSPRVALRGHLEVSAQDGGRVVERLPVDVAAGATKEHHLLLPPTTGLVIRYLPESGEAVTILRAFDPQGDATAVVAGVLGSAPDRLPTITSQPLDRRVHVAAVPRSLVERSPRALDPLDALVVEAAELAAMPERVREHVAAAVADGLHLVVTVEPDAASPGLPWDLATVATSTAGGVPELTAPDGAWTITTAQAGGTGDTVVAATSPVGRGRLTTTSVALGRAPLGDQGGLWDVLFQPRHDPGRIYGFDDVEDAASALFGGPIQLPPTAGLAAFLLAYVVVVGPLNAFVLRRLGRRELAWATIPAITVVFTLVAVASTVGRAPADSPAIEAQWWLDNAPGTAVTAVAVQAPGRGSRTLSFPEGTDVAQTGWGEAALVTRGNDGTRVSMALEPMESRTLLAWRSLAEPPPLEVRARLDGDRLEVEATNTSGAEIGDVEVRAGTHLKRLEEPLAPGQTAEVVLDGIDESLPGARPDANLRMVGDGRQPVDRGPRAGESLLRWTVLDGAPGPVWVTGTLPGGSGPAPPVVGTPLDDRGTYVAVGTTATVADATFGAAVVGREVVRGAQMSWRPAPLEVEPSGDLVLRYRLPVAVTAGQVRSTVDAGGLGGGFVEPHFDPWSSGCFEVTEIDAEGVAGEPVEHCGEEVACPPQSTSCGGDDRQIEACFPDGSCQVAVRIGSVEAVPVDPPEGQASEPLEFYDHRERSWVGGDAALDDDSSRLVSPLGEVLVRIRGGGWVDLSRRGLGWEAGDQ